jgi:MFS family permease
MTKLLSWLSEPFQAFAGIYRNKSLRRLEFAWATSVIGTWAYAIALAVYAYDAGGARAVGIAAVIRTLPTAVAGPIVSGLGDRYPRVKVMVGSDLSRALFFGLGALAITADAPPGVVYAISGLIMIAATPFRPAQGALLPALTSSAQELTAANVVSSTVESIGFFAGPALGGLLLAFSSPEVVFAVSGATCVWSALLLVGLPRDAPRPAPEPGTERGILRETVDGFRAVKEDSSLALIVTLFTAQTLVAGAVGVYVVVIALELFDSGAGGVGLLNSALGVGGIAGAAAAVALIGKRRLAGGFAVGLFLWGAPLIAIALVPEPAVGVLALAAVGVGNTLIDVAGFTLLQRVVPDHLLSRVMGIVETLFIASIGMGALLAPRLIEALDIKGALIATGLLLPVFTLLSWVALHRADVGAEPPSDILELLRSIAIFRPLPLATAEVLAARLVPMDVGPGEEVVREGEPGKRFYVIADGDFDVTVEGRHARDLGPGDFFGEIALLREVPRTATVTAVNGNGRLLALDREDFLAAITGSARSREEADMVAGTRLAAFKPRWLAV